MLSVAKNYHGHKSFLGVPQDEIESQDFDRLIKDFKWT